MFRELRAKKLLAVARNLTFFLIFPATSCQLLQGPVPSHLTPFSHPCSLIAPVSCILDRLTVLRFRVPLWYPYFPFIHCLPLECLPLFLLTPNSNTVCKCRAEPLQILQQSIPCNITPHHREWLLHETPSQQHRTKPSYLHVTCMSALAGCT